MQNSDYEQTSTTLTEICKDNSSIIFKFAYLSCLKVYICLFMFQYRYFLYVEQLCKFGHAYLQLISIQYL